MKKYIINRIIISMVTLLGVSILIFFLMLNQPGNPYMSLMSADMDEEIIESKLTELGYYDPIPIQYIKWLKRAISGDFGRSIRYKVPVIEMIKDRFKNTFILSGSAFIITAISSICFGIYSASRAGRLQDKLLTFITFLGISLPSFFFSLLLIKKFAYDLKIFPSSGITTVSKNLTGVDLILDVGYHLILPVLVLSFVQSAYLIRYIRADMIQILDEDYMKIGIYKGLSKREVIWKHGFKNSLVTIITLLSSKLPSLISGALITETVFVWPGIGTLGYSAVIQKDYPLIMGVTMSMAVIIIFLNFISDILYTIVDPRVRLNTSYKE